MFQVIGVDTDGGNVTVLNEFTNSGEAREWFRRYVSKEDAGGWNRIEVIDTRDECAETLWSWERE